MWMRKAFRLERWNHTSQILAMLFNANATESTQVQPWEFHPYDPRHYRPPPKGNISELKIFLPKHKKTSV